MADSKPTMYPQVSTGDNYGPSSPSPYGGQYGGQQSSQTTVIVNQPQQTNPLLVGSVEGHRDWTSGLFDCFSDISTCLFTWCCYPCAVCMLASRTGECFCTPGFVPGSDIILRTRIRTLGGIRGTMCNDCLTVACCGPCAACQEARELTQMGIP